MIEKYIAHGRKKLRCGYTTGSCAAGAAKASAKMLITGEIIDSVQICTPKEIRLELKINDISVDEVSVSCAVQKDSGDDPDITNGILVYARAEKILHGIIIAGGEGIGKVTKVGLDQPVGEWAINSVPRKMISSAVKEVFEEFDYHGGMKITIYVPNGKEIALKTYNPRMGIEGGISIIGTTGIVEPMSSAALIDTIRLEIKMRNEEQLKTLLLTIGNYSEGFLANQMPFALEKSVKCSNYIGDAIDIALEFGFENILIIGHIGKLVKLGAGIMNTHSAQADGRMDVIVTCGVLAGVESADLKKIPECATVDAALSILEENGVKDKTIVVLMQRAQHYLNAKVKNEAKIGAVMFSEKHMEAWKTPAADELIKLITEEYYG